MINILKRFETHGLKNLFEKLIKVKLVQFTWILINIHLVLASPTDECKRSNYKKKV